MPRLSVIGNMCCGPAKCTITPDRVSQQEILSDLPCWEKSCISFKLAGNGSRIIENTLQ